MTNSVQEQEENALVNISPPPPGELEDLQSKKSFPRHSLEMPPICAITSRRCHFQTCKQPLPLSRPAFRVSPQHQAGVGVLVGSAVPKAMCLASDPTLAHHLHGRPTSWHRCALQLGAVNI